MRVFPYRIQVGFQSEGEDAGCGVEGTESMVGPAGRWLAGRCLGFHSGELYPLAWKSRVRQAMEEET